MHNHPAGIPPDGGWGWVVVAAAFLVCAIVDGIAMNAATIYVNFPSFIRAMNAEHAKLPPPRCLIVNPNMQGGFEDVDCPVFNSSAISDNSFFLTDSEFEDGELSPAFEPMTNFFIGATLISIYMLIGPFSAALINVYGSRKIIIIGSVIAAIGFSLSALLIEHEHILLLTHGVAGGIGLGLMNVGAIVSVGMYFNTRRSLAIGLALCGSGAGMTIAPLVIEPILTKHGLYYAYVALSCFSLQGVVAGSLVRPLCQDQTSKKERTKDAVDRLIEWSKQVKHINEETDSLEDPEERERRIKQLMQKKHQRIIQLADSTPTSIVGSKMSLESQNSHPLHDSALGSSKHNESPANGKIDSYFCRIFGSDLISPVPRPVTVNSSSPVPATPSPVPAKETSLASDSSGIVTNSALAAAGLSLNPSPNSVADLNESSLAFNFSHRPNNNSIIPPPLIFLHVPVSTQTNNKSLSHHYQSQLPMQCSHPGTCVGSVLVDGNMFVVSKVLQSSSVSALSKSCPDLVNTQISHIRLRRRPITSNDDKSKFDKSCQICDKCRQSVNDMHVTPTSKRAERRRRRQRSSGPRFVPSTVFERSNENDQGSPQEESTPPPPMGLSTYNNLFDFGDNQVTLPEICQGTPQRIVRRRRCSTAKHEDSVEETSLLSEQNVNLAKIGDSGISNSSSSNNSDSSDGVAAKPLKQERVDKGHSRSSAKIRNPSKTSDNGYGQHFLLANDDLEAGILFSSDGYDEELTRSTKSYIERRKRRRRQLAGEEDSSSEQSFSRKNVFRHLLSVVQAILDIRLLSDIRFWIVLFGNLLLMVTFLLLPLNADVVRTIRALDTLKAQQDSGFADYDSELYSTGEYYYSDYGDVILPPDISSSSSTSPLNNSTTTTLNNFAATPVSSTEPTKLPAKKIMWTPDPNHMEVSELYEPMPHTYAILLSLCGCTQTVMRAVAGFFADYPRIDATAMVAVAMAVGSVAFLLLGIEKVLMFGLGIFFTLLIVVSACSGVFFALATSVIVDTFGVENLTSCFGMITMIRGLAPYATIGFMLSVSQLIELQTLEYGAEGAELLPFRYACLVCCVLALLCSILHCILYWIKKRRQWRAENLKLQDEEIDMGNISHFDEAARPNQ